MSEEEITVVVLDESRNQEITLQLSSREYQRAIGDSAYLQQIVDRHYATSIDSPSHQSQPTEDSENVEEGTSGTTDNAETSTVFIWHDSNIFLLLSLYEEKMEDFKTKRHKKVFEEIAKQMGETNQLPMTGGQCQSKINSLKKTYKKIIDHNRQSGNDRATWPYFDRMNEIFGSSGWANPVAVASEEGPGPEEQLQQNTPAAAPKKKRKLEDVLQDFFSEKKKLMAERNKFKKESTEALMELKERQHKEKMDILKELLNK